MKKDPFREAKDEFLHDLHNIHKGGNPVGSLDVGDMSAAKMILTGKMHSKGIVLSASETIDTIGEMAKVVGGDTLLAGQQIVSQKDYERRTRKVAAMQRRTEARARDLLMKRNTERRS